MSLVLAAIPRSKGVRGATLLIKYLPVHGYSQTIVSIATERQLREPKGPGPVLVSGAGRGAVRARWVLALRGSAGMDL